MRGALLAGMMRRQYCHDDLSLLAQEEKCFVCSY